MLNREDVTTLIKRMQAGEISKADALSAIDQLQAEMPQQSAVTSEEVVYHVTEPYVRDHLVNGKPLLLGVTFCSLVLAAARQAQPEGALQLKKILFEKVVDFEQTPAVAIRVQLNQWVNELRFACFAMDMHAKTDSRCASGTVALSESDALPAQLDFSAFDKLESQAGNSIYEQQATIKHGPSLQTIQQIKQQGLESLALLKLTEAMVQEARDYGGLHPGLLDGAITSALAGRINKTYIPFFIKAIHVYKNLEQECYCYAKHVQTTEELQAADIWLCNERGEAFVFIEGFTCKRLPEAGQDLKPAITQAQPAMVEQSALATKIQVYLINKLKTLNPDIKPSVVQQNFLDLGIDSNQLVQLTTELSQELGIDLYPTLFFEYANIQALTEYFAREYAHLLSSKLGVDSVAISTDTVPQVAVTAIPTAAVFAPTLSKPAVKELVSSKEIAIIGMQGVFAESANVEAFWENLRTGRDLIKEVPKDHWDIGPWFSADKAAKNKTYCKWGSFIDDVDKFDAAFFNISPREAELMDPQLRQLLQIMYRTAEDAGYITRIKGSNTGVFTGVCFLDYCATLLEEQYGADPYIGTGNSNTMYANRPSFTFNLTGPSISVDTACSSSLTAMHYACTALRNNECEMAFVNGINLLLGSYHYRYFSSLGALSATGRCHTFDERADGYVPGEAITSVLLKPLDKALAEGDMIYGVIKGSAVKHGGYTPSITAPSVEGELNTLLAAWEDAGIHPETLGYIEAHGTGTKLGDPIEIQALIKAFERYTDKKAFCAIGSAKAHIGHTEGAAGLVGVIKAVLSIKHQEIPALPQFEKLNPYIKVADSALTIAQQTEHWKRGSSPRRAGISSFGFGGAYAHVVVEEAPEQLVITDANKPCYLVTLSARQEEVLKQRLVDLAVWLDKHKEDPKLHLEAISYSLNVGRSHFEWRCALVVSSITELQQTLEQLQQQKEVAGCYYGQIEEKSHNAAIYRQVLKTNTEKLKDIAYSQSVEYKDNLEALANLYVVGHELDWQMLHQGEAQQRISLPSYPFLKKRYWVQAAKLANQVVVNDMPQTMLRQTNKVVPLTLKVPAGAEPLPKPSEAMKHKEDSFKAIAELRRLPDSQNQAQDIQINHAVNQHSQQDIVQAISTILKSLLYLETDELQLEKSFTEYGVDSILGVEFIKQINHHFGSDITAAKLYGYPTVTALADHILSILPKETAKPVLQPEVLPQISATESKASDISQVSSRLVLKTVEAAKHLAPDSGNTLTTLAPDLEAIAVIGMGLQLPGADSVDAFWELLMQGKNAISEIPEERWSIADYYDANPQTENKSYSKWGGFVADADKFDPLFFNISPQEAEWMDPQQRLFMQVSWQALEDAGYTTSQLNKSRCGIYVGVMNSDYQEILTKHAQQLNAQQMTGNAHSILAARIAYYLNLKGPVVTIDTACSSSLIALHQACQSLRQGEADIMLAGGVTLYLTETPYISMSKAGMLSAEGQCKTFDNSADGFVPGEGCTVIVLKRLKDAMRDGDKIYGVIKGSGINQDGKTNGITAPSGESQKALELDVYRNYQINPSEIGYVEAHGTGTRLGDPIEVEALTEAFREYTQQRNFCGIGSVKSNIGHTSAAAGVASIIKVLLMLQHKQLVPTINYQKPNEHIDFANSPFYVNTVCKEWKVANNKARLAAVSSFGFSGTNAHIIIEEAPAQGRSQSATKPYYLITLSAKQEAVLTQRLVDLQKWLIKHNEEDNLHLEAISYTLNAARSHFGWRCALIASSVKELQEKLELLLKQNKVSGYYYGHAEKEPTNAAIFKQVLKASTEKLKDADYSQQVEYKDNLEALANLYVEGYDIDWQLLHQGEAKQKISLPTYPFLKERYWVEMLPVSLTSGTTNRTLLHPLLSYNVSTLESQCYNTVLNATSFYLADHVIASNKLLPGVAYIEMARVAGELARPNAQVAGFKGIVWLQPVSVTDTLELSITLSPKGEEITYVVSSQEGEVIHSQGELIYGQARYHERLMLDELKQQGQMLEANNIYAQFSAQGFNYGPSFQSLQWLRIEGEQALGYLVLPTQVKQAADRKQYGLHPSLLDGALQAIIGLAGQTDKQYLPFAIEELWLYKALPDSCYVWVKKHVSSEAVQRYDITLADEQGNLLVAIQGFSVRASQVVNSSAMLAFYQPDWQAQQAVMSTQPIQLVLAIGASAKQRQALQAELGCPVITDKPVAALPAELSHIVYIAASEDDAQAIFALTQALMQSKRYPQLRLVYICSASDSLPYAALMRGLVKSIVLENPQYQYKVVELAAACSVQQWAEWVKTELQAEAQTERVIRYQQTVRYVERLVKLDINSSVRQLPLRQQGVYLITGGLGGLGLIFAKYLAKHYQAKLILTGRSALTDEQQLTELKALGSEVIYLTGDVANEDEIQAIIQQAKARFKVIHGIIHSAGVVKDSILLKKHQEDFAQVLTPKVQGTINLDKAAAAEALDFMVLFSSMASVVGNIGQCDYASANAFMDSFASWRNAQVEQGKRQGHTLSINWPLWAEGGMQIDAASQAYINQSLGMEVLPTQAGLKAFEQLLQHNLTQALVVYGNKQQLDKYLLMQTSVADSASTAQVATTTTLAVDSITIRSQLEQTLVQTISQLLKVKPEQIDSEEELSHYGFDSVTFTQLVNQLNQQLSLSLTPAIMFEYPTLRQFAEHLLAQYPEKLAAHYQLKTPSIVPPVTKETRLINKATAVIASPAVNPSAKDIAIIGMQGLLPGSNSLEEFWQHLVEGHDLISEVPVARWDYKAYEEVSKWGGFIADIDKFDAAFFNLSPKEVELMDPQQRLFLQVVWQAIEAAGYAVKDLAKQKTGLFVGVASQDYAELLQAYGIRDAHVPTGVAHSVLANRVSYLLNLTGPSEAVDTACSSSLVALHRGVRALQTGDCEVAIVGGVNALLTPSLSISFSRAGMLSPDGRCKTFDKAANGYVRGEGVGAILLKPLVKAQADGDYIHAVIKGSSVNHGGHVNTLTTPNPNAQAGLIIEACQHAAITPDSISYIEAHGTGTSLGDPVEVNGLKKAFASLAQTQGIKLAEHRCGIGSVKANIGHLETAAGIAGLLKLLLMFKHQTLPKQVHFETCNPYLELKGSPFYIVDKTQAWEIKPGSRRRAGISSFGFGGANAHVVLEEALVQPEKGYANKPYYLVTLSAKQESVLKQRLVDLQGWLSQQQGNAHLEAISYTLNVGRSHFSWRCALVVSSLADLQEKLAQLRKHSKAGVAGCYYTQAEKVPTDAAIYKQVLKASTEKLKETYQPADYKENLEALANLYVAGYELDWQLLHQGEAQQRISLPTYPFTKERYWIPAAKAKPVMMHMNHKQDLPILHPLVQQNISGLQGTAFSSNWQGNEFYLQDHQAQGQRILPGVAYLEMARAAVMLAAPSYRIIGIQNITWLMPVLVAEATKQVFIELTPPNSSKQVAYTVYSGDERLVHSQGMVVLDEARPAPAAWELPASLELRLTQLLSKETIYSNFKKLDLMYGPTFQALQWVKTDGLMALGYYELPTSLQAEAGLYGLHPSILDSALQSLAVLSLDSPSALELPFALEALWSYQNLPAKGYIISRKGEKNSERVKSYDLQLIDELGTVCVELFGFSTRPITSQSQVKKQSSLHYLLPQWREEALPISNTSDAPKGIAVLSSRHDLISALKAAWPQVPVLTLQLGSVFQKQEEGKYELAVGDEKGMQAWWQAMQLEGIAISHLIIDATTSDISEFIEQALQAQVLLLKTRMQLKVPEVLSWVNIYIQNQSELSYGEMLASFAKTLYQEHPKYQGCVIGVASSDTEVLRTVLQAEIAIKHNQPSHIRYEGSRRLIESLLEEEKVASTSVSVGKGFRERGLYLITGGFGGLGRLVAEYLIKHYQANLILTGRSEPSEEQQRQLEAWRAQGVKVEYYQGNVAERAVVIHWIESAKQEFGQLNGIIHSAGILKDGLLLNKSWEDFKAVMAAKVQGTLNLDAATQAESLDCFVLFSSIAGLFGNSGQSDYAMANGFMNAFAHWRSCQSEQGKRQGKTVSINWPLWQEGGMQVSAEIENYFAAQGITLLSTSQGVEILENALAGNYIHLGAYAKLISKERVTQEQKMAALDQQQIELAITDTMLREKILDELKHHVSEVLKVPVSSLDPTEDLSNYGFDSITFTDFANRLKQRYPINIAPTVFFEYPTLAVFTDYLLSEHQNSLQSLYQPELIAKSTPVAVAQSVTTHLSLAKPTPIAEQPALRQSMAPQIKDIAVIGMAGMFPDAPELDSFWKNLAEGKDCISEIPADRWDWKAYQTAELALPKWGGFINDIDKFDASFFGISPREAELMDPQQRLFLQCVWKSLEDAGYLPDQERSSSVGLFVGVASQDYAELIKQHVAIDAYTATGVAHSILANRVSYLLNLTGPSEAIETACSSSLVAIHRAVQAIQMGDCDLAVAGGVNALITPSLYVAFTKAGMLSPDGRCKTFDKSANGYVRGEGVGAIVLKSLSQALADGDPIHGIIKGSAVNHGGHVNTLTAPNPNAQAELIKTAYRRAGFPVSTVSFIEAHGTGTSLGDPIEINALKKAFKALQKEEPLNQVIEPRCGISAVKTNIGHLETAAGIAGIIKVLLAMRYKVLPGIANFQELNPYIDLAQSGFYLVTKTQAWESLKDNNGQTIPRRAGVSSFGFGGVNAHIAVEEPPICNNAAIPEKPYYLLTFSAKNAEALQQKLIDFREWLLHPDRSEVSLAAISYTLNAARQHFNYRCAIVVTAAEREHLSERLEQIIQQQNVPNVFTGILTGSQPDDAAIYEEVYERTAEQLMTIGYADLKKYEKQLRVIANLYVKGYMIDWKLLHKNEPQQKISLPTYPFAKTRHWFPLENSNLNKAPLAVINTDWSQDNLFSEILTLLKTKLAELTKIAPENLDVYEDLSNYGFDSIVIAELGKELEKTFGKQDMSLFFAAKNIHDLASKIYEKHNNGVLAIQNSQHQVHPVNSVATADQVAIIGISGRYAQAGDVCQFYEILKQGKNVIGEIPDIRWNYKKYFDEDTASQGTMYAKWGSFIENIDSFDYEHFNMSFNEALVVHPEERLLLEEAWHCFESAGYNPSQWTKQKTNTIGVYIGASFHDYQQLVAEANQHRGDYLPFTSQTYSYANRLSYYFNLKGPSVTLDTACSSSLFAISEAYYAIQAGRCNMALAGGVNLNLHPSKYILLSQFNFMAKDGQCHAFTEGGSGYVPGEGIGLVLLKRLTDAVRDQDNILAVIKGAAAGNDGKTNGFTVPNPEAQTEVISTALKQANISPTNISFVECHGTGTQLGDPIEIAALTSVFEKDKLEKQCCAVSSVKSNIGHLEAAAGIAQVTKVVLQMQSQQLFPNVMHGLKLNSHIKFSDTPFYVQDHLASWTVAVNSPKYAGISSFGAGGTNVHLVLQEYSHPHTATVSESEHIVCPLSAETEAQLFETIKKLYVFLAEGHYHIFNNDYQVKNIAGTLRYGRAEKRCRLAIVCENNLASFLDVLQDIVEYYQRHKVFKGTDKVFFNQLNGAHKIPSSQNQAIATQAVSTSNTRERMLNYAKDWVQGEILNWQHISSNYQKVFLPGYSFKQKLIRLAVDMPVAVPLVQSASSQEDTAKAKIQMHVKAVFKKILGDLPDSFDDNESFANLGLDSISGSRIHAELEKEYKGLDDFALLENDSLQKLTAHLYECYQKKANQLEESTINAVDDEEAVGNITNLMAEEKLKLLAHQDILVVEDYINFYQADGGQLPIKIEKIKLANNKLIEIMICGEGEPVIFLPPFNTTGIVWFNQIAHLSQHFKVVVIHYPGIGGSDWIENLKTFDDLAKIIIEVIDLMQAKQLINSNVVSLIGWSFGGFLAQTIASEYPDYIKRLILVSTTLISWSSKEYKISGEEFSRRSAEQFKKYYRRLPVFIRKMPQVKKLYTENKIEVFVLGTTDNLVINTYFLMIAKFRHQNTAEKIKVKTYLISGESDDLMPAKFARQLHQTIPNSDYYEVKGGEHFMSLFNKNIVNKKLSEWLTAKL